MRFAIVGALLLLCGCGPGLIFNSTQDMTREEMLARASHVFIGVIQKHEFESWPFFRVNIPGRDPSTEKYWRVLRREVHIETVLRGTESRKVVDVYEIFWTGGTSGDWNSTHDGDRDLFLVRIENGRYHVARDWWRSIFTVTSGPHAHLPLDDSRPLWERVALMNYWIERSDSTVRLSYPYFRYSDPGGALSLWRTVKLWRGLVRHPSAGVRVPACRELLQLGGLDQNECWDALSENDRSHLRDGGYFCCSSDEIAVTRRQVQQRNTSGWWKHSDRDRRRLLTAMNDRELRAEFCRLYTRAYPGDTETGCPPDRPPPATIVTAQGDVPLTGPWPR